MSYPKLTLALTKWRRKAASQEEHGTDLRAEDVESEAPDDPFYVQVQATVTT